MTLEVHFWRKSRTLDERIFVAFSITWLRWISVSKIVVSIFGGGGGWCVQTLDHCHLAVPPLVLLCWLEPVQLHSRTQKVVTIKRATLHSFFVQVCQHRKDEGWVACRRTIREGSVGIWSDCSS